MNDDTVKHNKKVTLQDVALLANVSAITVSRVLNHPDKVSSSITQRVIKAINNLGYIPNLHASSLASAKSKVIGVAIPSLSNIVFTDVLRGIYDVMGVSGYKVLLVNTHYSPLEEEEMIRTLLSHSPEGLIITGGDQTKTCHSLLVRASIPVVQMMELIEQPIDMNVGFSHYQAGFDVTQSFIKNDYQRIAFMGARMDTRVQHRFNGYKAALELAQLNYEDYVVTTPEPSSIQIGGDLLKSIMSSSKGSIDAIFCANDDLALGALFECQRMNIRVPQELAICGFNDIEAASYVNPSLTSVHVGRYAMGVKASEMLLDAIKNVPIESKIVDLGFEIKQRQSTLRTSTSKKVS